MAEIDLSFLSSSECSFPAVSHIISLLYSQILNSPYYIWLGRPRSCDVTQACHAFEIEGGNLIGNCSPTLSRQENKDLEVVPPLEIGELVVDVQQLACGSQTVIDISPPLSSFHYQVNKVGCLFRLGCILFTLQRSHGDSLITSTRYTKNSELSFILSHG